ncbi:right-handed parallel beta-helix repeat-containing protein, partial [Bartonella sp. MM73XJBT]|uniref:beta strand repeat-containing protein n=1 Tax=Bartonella sp. MM73XJBT TaxID=3019095 RepID=UPI00235DCDD0
MYKKSLLSSMATAAIMLFNIQFNVHAESLKVSGEKKEVKDATYETLQSLEEGQITGTDLKITGNKDTNSSSNENNYVISTEGKGSAIKLTGDKTTIKGTDSDIPLGVEAKNDAILQMTGGTITVSHTGVHFENSNSTENKLENVTISSSKDDAALGYGISTDKSTVALNNVKVSQATNAIVADDNSQITVSGGSFNAKLATIASHGNSIVTLTNDAQITSSENDGLLAKDGGAISMTGGTIKASNVGAHFENSKRKENKLENVTISSGKDDTLLQNGIKADDSIVALNNITVTKVGNAIVADDNSQITISGGSFDAKKVTIDSQGNSIVTLTNDAQITSSEDNGLLAKDGGAISMTGGAIKASIAGAAFKNSKREENKLENVTITNVKDDALLVAGIAAEQNSKVALNNVTVTKAESAIVADDNSQITVSGGSFDAKETTIYAQKDSTITLTDEARITSSEDSGLFAKDGAAISMTGGTIKASIAGAAFKNSKREENKLKNVTISSVKDDALLAAGIAAKQNSKVDLNNVTVTKVGNAIVADDNSQITVSGGSFDAKNATIVSQGNSIVTLINDAQITSSEDSGLFAKNGGAISMTGGTIKASIAGAAFKNSNREENKLENVTISSGKDDALLMHGIDANNSTITLNNVTVTQATNAIVADDNSQITVSGGSFDAKLATITSKGNSIVSLINDAQITSSENDGLYAKDGGAISMTGGTIKAFYNGAAFENSKREENKLENVTISNIKGDALLHYGIDAEKNSTVALTNVTVTKAENAIAADDNSQITVSGGSFDAKLATIYAQKGSTITLTDEARITSSEDSGLFAKEGGAISMTGGTIKASIAGAAFKNSNSAENKLKNVTISNVKDDALLAAGITAEQNSKVDLTNVTVTQATNAIVADDNSQITVSGGSFDAKLATIYAQKGSTITLTDEARITSSEDVGLFAKEGGAISMTGGNIKSSKAGAAFENSNSAENKLKNVTISSVKDDALLDAGITAEQNSTVALTNVTVTQATNAIVADDNSQITVSGGSFDAKLATIYAQKGSTITLTDEARITSSDGNGLYANGLGSTITMTKGNVTGRYTTLVTEDGGHITATDITIATTKGSGLGANAINSNSTIELYETTINNASIGLYAQNGGTIKMTGGTITTSTSGASFSNSKSDENKLKDVTISNNKKGNSLIFVGLNSQSSNVSLENVHITDAYIGAFAMDHSEVTISGGSFDGSNAAISAESGSTITLTDNVQITSSNGNGLHANGSDSTITMTGGTVTGKEAVLFAENGGHINVTNISATAENSGIKFKNPEENITSEINLTNAKLHIKDGIGINVDESTATVNLSKKSEIGADVLLVTKASTKEDNFAFTLNANDSILEGRASIAQERNVRFDLKNNTQWILKTSTQEKDDDGNLLDIAQRSRSDISVLNLENSSLVFKEPTADGYYHTLHIGSGKPDTKVVYNATGDAKIYFNTKWTDGTPIEEQKTDHLLIHGDVSGSTTVYIQSDSGDKNSVINASDPSNSGGLSLIQVSGKAEEDSFKLTNGYTTRGGSPYKYTLTGYGPESSHGIANVEQSLFDEKNENFWDFRLHKEFLDSHSTVEAPVGQMASYLVMPNALFYTGLTDMAKQNALLDNMRTSVVAKEQEKQSGFFLY